MKRINFKLAYLILFIIDVVLSLLVFFVTPEDIRESSNFIVSWFFAAVVGILGTMAVIGYANRDKKTRLIALGSTLSSCIFFGAAYIIYFIISAYFIQNLIITVIAEILITAAYVVFVLIKITDVHFLRQVNQNQEKTIRATKKSYIPELLEQLSAARELVSDKELRASLKELSSDISSSPKLSSQNAEMTERELSAIVYQINQYVMLKEYGELENLIRKAKMKLSERNSKCH